MAKDKNKSMIGMKCEYCDMVIENKPWFAPVRKELLGKEHVFCTESCFVHYLYKVPKDRVLGIRGWGA